MDAVKTSIKLAELMSYKGEMPVEVVGGQLREMSLDGGLHHIIAGNIHNFLDQWVSKSKIGYSFMDGFIYLLEWDEENEHIRQARIPDTSFVKSFPQNWDIEKPFPGAPTLAVEVISPNDDPDEMLAKVREYLNAGSEQVWVVYPRQKEVHQYQRSAPQVQTYRANDTLDAGDLMAGLLINVGDFFRLPAASE
jgi:Uma2 family endonuclease